MGQDSIGRRRDALWAIHPALVSLQEEDVESEKNMEEEKKEEKKEEEKEEEHLERVEEKVEELPAEEKEKSETELLQKLEEADLGILRRKEELVSLQDSIGRRRDALWAIHPALVSLQEEDVESEK